MAIEKFIWLIRTVIYKVKFISNSMFIWPGHQSGKLHVFADKGSKINVDRDAWFSDGNIKVRDNAELIIKKGTYFNNNCFINARKRILIDENSIFGPNVVIVDNNHDYKSESMKNTFLTDDIIIGRNVWVGANVVILSGVKIGNNAIIGAGTVVRNDVLDNVVYRTDSNVVTKEYKRDETNKMS